MYLLALSARFVDRGFVPFTHDRRHNLHGVTGLLKYAVAYGDNPRVTVLKIEFYNQIRVSAVRDC